MNISLKGGQTGIQQPLTVHIQQTEQGARLMIPAGQLSQLPGKSREGSGVQLETNLTEKKNLSSLMVSLYIYVPLQTSH